MALKVAMLMYLFSRFIALAIDAENADELNGYSASTGKKLKRYKKFKLIILIPEKRLDCAGKYDQVFLVATF
jgi:hypothetical protein